MAGLPGGRSDVALQVACAFPSHEGDWDDALGFDGVVTAIDEVRYDIDFFAEYRQVTLQVREWFHGGEAERVTVLMPAPGDDAGHYRVGARMLIMADPFRPAYAVSGVCGSALYHPYYADQWRRDFAPAQR